MFGLSLIVTITLYALTAMILFVVFRGMVGGMAFCAATLNGLASR
jgi:hypothetical protein